MEEPAEASLSDIVRGLHAARRSIIAGLLLGLMLACLVVLLLPRSYRAVMVVASADGYALGDYASAHGGTTSTYDKIVSLPFWRPMEPEGISTDFYRFVQTSRGPSVADILLKDDNILKTLPDGAIENAASLSDYNMRRVDIQPVGATPLRKLTYYHPDREFAAIYLRKLHLVADQLIRRDRRRMAQARIDYLSTALTRTSNPDHRRVITGLLMQQEHILMLANLDEPYAAIIVEPAFASAKPVWPDIPLTFGGLALIGAFCGFAVHALRKAAA